MGLRRSKWIVAGTNPSELLYEIRPINAGLLRTDGVYKSKRRPEDFPNRITPLALELEAHLEKLCNAIGLPPMLCVFMVLGVCAGLLGIVRTVNHTNLTTAMVLGTR